MDLLGCFLIWYLVTIATIIYNPVCWLGYGCMLQCFGIYSQQTHIQVYESFSTLKVFENSVFWTIMLFRMIYHILEIITLALWIPPPNHIEINRDSFILKYNISRLDIKTCWSAQGTWILPPGTWTLEFACPTRQVFFLIMKHRWISQNGAQEYRIVITPHIKFWALCCKMTVSPSVGYFWISHL